MTATRATTAVANRAAMAPLDTPGTVATGWFRAAILFEVTPTRLEGFPTMPSGAELIRQIKGQIKEVDPREVHEAVHNGNGSAPVLVDVREQHEFEEAHIPGAIHVPRGHLESRIEGKVGDKHGPVVLYCASGQRSALAAHTLQSLLGYDDVASMTGGITLWKDRGYEVETPRALDADQKSRYSRHVLLPEIGVEGQLTLLDAKVLLLGAGGLGSPTALYLAAAGVGTLGLVDNDVVDMSNLQRQVAHSNDRIGMPKVDSAEIAIKEINPEVKVVKYQERLDASNIMDILPGYDVVVDGLDNFPTRYLLNDASVRLQIPVVSASILGWDGQISVFKPYEGPCYRCLYPTPPPAELAPSCGANGVLGALPGVMGMFQPVETVKLIIGAGEPLIGRLMLYDAMQETTTELKVRRDPNCPICSRSPEEISDEEMGAFPDYEAFCAGV